MLLLRANLNRCAEVIAFLCGHIAGPDELRRWSILVVFKLGVFVYVVSLFGHILVRSDQFLFFELFFEIIVKIVVEIILVEVIFALHFVMLVEILVIFVKVILYAAANRSGHYD